ncbi:hypothetical protein BDC45DRAFT_162667 [Circinella umbellata]|nr:hypothetical protein BDC45DRAFT_162667 [Circinella umbellata]
MIVLFSYSFVPLALLRIFKAHIIHKKKKNNGIGKTQPLYIKYICNSKKKSSTSEHYEFIVILIYYLNITTILFLFAPKLSMINRFGRRTQFPSSITLHICKKKVELFVFFCFNELQIEPLVKKNKFSYLHTIIQKFPHSITCHILSVIAATLH